MKMGADRIVPLPRQAIAMLKELHNLTGKGKYIFASAWTMWTMEPWSNSVCI
jgi:integrase